MTAEEKDEIINRLRKLTELTGNAMNEKTKIHEKLLKLSESQQQAASVNFISGLLMPNLEKTEELTKSMELYQKSIGLLQTPLF
jgi:hypothetical protein